MTENNPIPTSDTGMPEVEVFNVKPSTSGISKIVKNFKQFSHKITKIWVAYNINAHYFKELHELIKNDEVADFKIEYLSNNTLHPYEKKNIFGLIHQSINVVNPKRTLIELVGLTEHYLQEITEIIYKEFPGKLKGYEGRSDSKDEQSTRQQKLITLILESSDKEEMLDKIIEEKVRNIFYGNPIDFFSKDKAKIGIGKFFESNHLETLKIFEEIIARRNIFIHNDGRVDRKYLREANNSSYKLGHKIQTDKMYLKEAVIILRGISCVVTKLILENTFNAKKIDTGIQKIYKAFHKKYNVKT